MIMNHGKENFGAPQCVHFKFNDEQCRQPALRHKKYCRFHNFMHEQTSVPSNGRLLIPLAEDTSSIQIAINQIMRGIISGDIDHKTAWLLLYSLQLSTSNLAKQRDVFPPPPESEPEEEEQPPSLAKILLDKLREDAPNAFTEEEHQHIFHQPPPSFPGYPEMPPPAGFLREPAKTEEPPNTPPNT
jgi:hypothetical protein